MSKLIAGTRAHGTHSDRPDLGQLVDWCGAALEYADEVLIAVDAAAVKQARSLVAHLAPMVQVLLVSPWEGHTPALNALLGAARRREATQLLLQSLEVRVPGQDVARLRELAGPDVLVVGARLTPEHGGEAGSRPISGETSPWNTLALWDVATLGLTGFLAVSDSTPDSPGGVEEVVAISLLQHLRPGSARAVLTPLNGLTWDTSWSERSRIEHQRWKMPTKVERAEHQLALLAVPRGTVEVL